MDIHSAAGPFESNRDIAVETDPLRSDERPSKTFSVIQRLDFFGLGFFRVLAGKTAFDLFGFRQDGSHFVINCPAISGSTGGLHRQSFGRPNVIGIDRIFY